MGFYGRVWYYAKYYFNGGPSKKIVEALKNQIDDIRLYDTKERNRLRFKTTKNLLQRKSDRAIVDRAEEKISEIQKIIEDLKK